MSIGDAKTIVQIVMGDTEVFRGGSMTARAVKRTESRKKYYTELVSVCRLERAKLTSIVTRKSKKRTRRKVKDGRMNLVSVHTSYYQTPIMR